MTDSPTDDVTLRWNEPLAVEVTAAVQRGQPDRVRRPMEKHPGLARARILEDGEAAGSRTFLHLLADWPGHRRNPHEIVNVLHEFGADLDASCDPTKVSETPLQWAASNDDVELVDALLDAGADINAPGSTINGLGPIADAAIFRGIRAGRRLVERGALANISQAAALGFIDLVRTELTAEPKPDAERITAACWAACGSGSGSGSGNQRIAELLPTEGTDINWIGWTDETPLDKTHCAEADGLADWLETRGTKSAAQLGH